MEIRADDPSLEVHVSKPLLSLNMIMT